MTAAASGSSELLSIFDQYRPALFGLAYRMLGSVMDAEDMVQETFLRWQQAPVAAVESPKPYLLTIITRLCINQLRSARVRREAYVGPWLPEPIVEAATADPTAQLESADTLSFAFLLLLERLTPLERAVFLLHDVFDYTYEEVAPLVGTNGAHCRQLGRRARERVGAGRPRFTADPAQVERITQQFMHAYMDGDMQGLLALFAEDVTLWNDGGGKVAAARNRVVGPDRVARFHVGVRSKEARPLTYGLARVNGQPGIVSWLHGQTNRVIAVDLDADGKIRAVYWVLNPDKLRLVPVLPGEEP